MFWVVRRVNLTASLYDVTLFGMMEMLEFVCTIANAITAYITGKRQGEKIDAISEKLDRLASAVERISPPVEVSLIEKSISQNSDRIVSVVGTMDSLISDSDRMSRQYVEKLTWNVLVDEFGPRLGKIVLKDGKFQRC